MTEPRITRDREDIQRWADERDAVPVREGDRVRLVRESDVSEPDERIDWDAFHREMDDEDRVVTYYGETEDRDPFEVGDRDSALDRAASESDGFDRAEAEKRLLEGETVTGTASETTAVETDTEAETAAVETDTEVETDAEEGRILPEKRDEGKPVVYVSGNQIGEVIDVNDGAAFVDPHPSLAEKVMARLGVDEDEEYYRLHEDRIERITDDEVVISTGEFADEPAEDDR